jgi:hypothetical protein
MKLVYEALEQRLMMSHHHHHPHLPIPQPPPVVPPPIVSPPVVPPGTVGVKPIGYQVFYQAGQDANASLHSTQSYVRYNWSDVESAPGVFHFGAMDADYAAAVKAGQSYNFRIMAWADGNNGPTGLASLGGTWLRYGGTRTFQPNLNLPAVQADLDRWLAAAGARYAQHTATVDAGWWMPFGEYSNYNVDTQGPRPTTATMLWMIAEIKKYFPHSYAIVQEGIATDDPATFKACLAAGAGVRWDSWHSNNSWQENEHKASFAMINATQQWKIAPMILEPWSTPSWSASDWSAAVDEAINTYHAWSWSTKGNPIPSFAIPIVDQLLAYEATL